MDSEQRQHLEKLRGVYRDRLHVLELQAANKGHDTPPHIPLEIQDIKSKIAEIDDLLAGRKSVVNIQEGLTRYPGLLLVVLVILAVIVAGLTYNLGANAGLTRAQPTIDALQTQIAEATAVAPSSDSNILSINSLPVTVYSWFSPEVITETRAVSLSIVNAYELTRTYQLEYTFPATSTQILRAGVAFKFTSDQDLTAYKSIRVKVAFDAKETRCSFDLRDKWETLNSVMLGFGEIRNSDISIAIEGETQVITIPLDTYYPRVNRRFVRDMGCAVSTEITQGKHWFIIKEIAFIK